MLLGVLVVFLALLAFANAFRQHARLKSIPGPLIAGVSRWWHIYMRTSQDYGRELSALHAKYGKIFRLGPNHISVSDPEVISQLCLSQTYSISLSSNAQISPNFDDYGDHGTPTASFRQPIRFDEYEGINDVPRKQLLSAVNRQHYVDLAAWLRIFATTFIDTFIFDEPSNTARMKTRSTNAHSPQITSIVDHILFNSPISSMKRYRGRQLIHYAMRSIHNLAIPAQSAGLAKPTPDSSITSNDSIPASDDLASEAESMIAAFVSVFPFLLRYPQILSILQHEIDSAYITGALSDTPRWGEIRRLSYLSAVMKESLRLSCSPNTDREFRTSASYDLRSEPAIPSGTTIIICNAYVAQFNREIYGDDAHLFRPERWLPVADDNAQQRKRMDQALLLFHPGLRTNTRLRAVWLELKKVVVQLLLKFDIQPLSNTDIEPTLDVLGSSPTVCMSPRRPGL
ncbi:putative cytochrome P450 monooxygenase [Aspergillus homomorphus CBS 101889]|uniref:Cytochrome P450 n=1 Tax=Aspergillus homomorphus (strain CBS 101889) TaxID=1450537 RepID=A0A395HYB6_ASPHC|nr:cytochrome P450 [Aspergillus homomorphus CBS 101889]RAL12499.1 cytochrome P450 [Aspergillus homomorphus CBS 101889]